jgi:hypothetical protein
MKEHCAMNMKMVRPFWWVALAGGLALNSPQVVAQSATTLPDAQVESNVLKALASASDLADQNIQSTTVYGVVTLTGNVHDEAKRTEAENLAARAQGVKKVVDELTLGDSPAPAAAASTGGASDATSAGAPGPGMVLQSDGTYAPANAAATSSQPEPGQTPQPTPEEANNTSAPPPPPSGGQPYNAQPAPPPLPERQPMTNRYTPPPGAQGGQQAGLPVTVPAGAVLQVRLNRGFDSGHVAPGTPFTGIVMADVVADRVVAVPRGATVSGVVNDAKKAGVFKGQGGLSMQINSLTIGGTVYPLQTDVWERNGRDKTAGTVDRTAGLGALGALVGAVAGGGAGAAIGAGVGAGAGLESSASGPRGEIVVPPESVLNFRLAAPLSVRTVSEQEMMRLAYSAGPQRPPRPRMVRYYSPYYGYYYAPAPPMPPAPEE